jgi:hypothetical protein
VWRSRNRPPQTPPNGSVHHSRQKQRRRVWRSRNRQPQTPPHGSVHHPRQKQRRRVWRSRNSQPQTPPYGSRNFEIVSTLCQPFFLNLFTPPLLTLR